MRVFLPLDASGASCNGQNSANPWVKPCFLRCCVFQTAINICAKTSPKCPTKTSQKRQKSEKRHSGQASKKHLFFQSVLFSKCVRKAPQTGRPPPYIWTHFSTFFRTWLARVAQTPQNVICYTILLQKSWKSCIGLLFDAFLLHRFCLHTCACASVLVHLFSPFVGYVFPSSC